MRAHLNEAARRGVCSLSPDVRPEARWLAEVTAPGLRRHAGVIAHQSELTPADVTVHVVETDGWEAHGTPHAFQADRTATNALQLLRWTVLRFTWADLRDRPRKVAEAVRRALG